MTGTRKDKRGRVLRKGEGFEESTGRYFFRYQGSDGRRRKISAKSLTELREKEEKALEENKKSAAGPKKEELTLTQCFEKAMHLKETARSLKQGTILRYRAYWQGQVGRLGERPAESVNGAEVQELLAGLVEKGYSAAVLKGMKNVLALSFRYAMSAKLREDNPMEEWLVKEITRGAKKASHHQALSSAQEEALISFCFSCQEEIPALCEEYERILVLFGTGLRFGELSGLTWGDIDFEEGCLYVRRQAIYDKGEDGKKRWRLDTPKSEAGIRKVYLPAEVGECLALLKERKKDVPCQAIDGVTDFCFRNSTGGLMDETRFNSLLRKGVEGYNSLHPEAPLPPFTAHSARSTNITRRAENGTPDRVIKNQVGHKEKDILMETYAQLVDEEKLKKAALAGLPFSGHPLRR